jgi:hypothetical protein
MELINPITFGPTFEGRTSFQLKGYKELWNL